MGIVSFFKKVFTGETEDPELEAARARHNIVVEKMQDKREKDEDKEPYDPWSEVDNLRRNFFIGSWASRKFRIIGEDKVKAELEALRKKREEKEARRKEEKGE
jgi:hypothetical protein